MEPAGFIEPGLIQQYRVRIIQEYYGTKIQQYESADVELEIADAFKGRSGSHDEDDDGDTDLR